jgi:hypothetical protein
MLALVDVDAQQTVARGYDVTGVITAPMDDGQTLIAISGSSMVAADTTNEWVFFFLDTRFLGTDTTEPSSQLELAGSPGAGQVDVRYVDDASDGSPVTVTYTWTGDALAPSGTPPGH